MALQNLRSGVANKRPIPTIMSEGQIALNTNEASPGLFFKDSNGDLVKVGPVHIGTSAPNSSPASTAATALVTGATYQILTVGTSDFTSVGASANTVGVVFTATGTTTGTGTVSGQQGVEKGEQWLDTTGGNYVLKIYDGTAWRSEAGEFVNVSGDTMTGALLLDNAASASAPDLSFDGDANTGVYSPGADQFGVATGGTSRLVIDSSGRLLVGTSSSSQVNTAVFQGNSSGGSAPGVTLASTINNPSSTQVLGKLAFSDNGHVDAASIKAARDSGTWTSGSSQPSSLAFFTTADGASSPTERMRIDSSGNLLFKQEAASNYPEQKLKWSNDSTTTNGFYISQDTSRNGRVWHEQGLDILFGTTNQERMRIDSAGHVGIGTTPQRNLHIHSSDSSTNTYLQLTSATTGASSTDGFQLWAYGNGGNLNATIAQRENADLEFWTNNTEQMRIDSSGNLGIGTTSMAYGLELSGTGNKAGFRISDTTNSRFVDLRADATGGLLKTAGAYPFVFSTNNAEAMRIDSSGNVGIGATSVGANLEIKENATTGTNHSMQIWRTASGGFMQLRVENLGLSQPYHEFTTGTNEDIVFNPGGNVGIGATSPSEALEVRAGTANVRLRSNDAGSNCELRFMPRTSSGTSNWNSSITGITGALTFGVGSAANGAPTERMRIDSSGTVQIAMGGSGYATLFKYGSNEDNYIRSGVNGITAFGDHNNGERMRIDSSGRLLVGTSDGNAISQDMRLQVEGNSYQTSGASLRRNTNDAGGTALRICKSRGTSNGSFTAVNSGDTVGIVQFCGADGNSDDTAAEIRGEVDGSVANGQMPGRIAFSTNSGSVGASATERLRIDSNGRLTQATDTYNFTTVDAANMSISSTGNIRRSTSSLRYKTDVETMEDSYADNILNARPVWYRSLCDDDNPSYGYWGFIAEEISEIDPRLCFYSQDENGDQQVDGVAYDRFVPHLLNLIKRQGEAIADLQAEVAALKA